MVGFGAALPQLVLPPIIAEQVFCVLGVDGHELSLGAAFGHQRRDEELGESVEGVVEGCAGYLEEIVRLGLAGVGI